MKIQLKLATILFILTAAIFLTACAPAVGSGGNDTVYVTFSDAKQVEGISDKATTTGLTLSFDKDPGSLIADDITLTGATKGELTGSGTTRNLAISNITVANGAKILVELSGVQKTAVVYKDTRTAIVFQTVLQTGGTDNTTDSTALILTFDTDPLKLTTDHITVTGATKGALGGSRTTRTLALSDLTVANGAEVSVMITSPAGYSISSTPKTAVVYREINIGVPYQGGIIAYIFQYNDIGYVAGETHGLIAATEDQSTGVRWITGGETQTTYVNGVEMGGTLKDIGSGQNNTIAMMNQLGYTGGAAKVCNDYINTDTGTGVFSDWYLPAADELNKMYYNKAAIGGFAEGLYWSSSEGYSYGAWNQHFLYGYQYHITFTKSDSERVRAVRSF